MYDLTLYILYYIIFNEENYSDAQKRIKMTQFMK